MPQMPVLCVPIAKRAHRPTTRPMQIETMTPVTEFHELMMRSTAPMIRMFQPHLIEERVRRGPAVVRNAAMAA